MKDSQMDSKQLSPISSSDDEIDLGDLLRTLWRQRGVIVGCVIFTTLAAFTFHLAKGVFSIAERVEQPVSLVFLDSKGVYPNGLPFSPQDIIRSRVLNVVAKKHNFDVDTLSKAVSVEYSNSLLKISEDKLKGLLTNTKTPNDVLVATNTILHQMRDETRSTVTLSVDLKLAGASVRQSEELLQDILTVWSQQTIERGLMNADISYPASAFEASSKSSLIDIFDSLNQYARSLEEATTSLSILSGSQSLIVGGQSLDDLKRSLVSLIVTDIQPLRSFAYSNSGIISEQSSNIYIRLKSRERLLLLEHIKLTQLIKSYDDLLRHLLKSVDNQEEGRAISSQSQTAQFDQSLLGSLLELGNKLSYVELREQVYHKRIKAVEDKLELEKELEILRGVKNESDNEKEIMEMLHNTLQIVTEEINLAQKQLKDFIVAYREQLNSGANLYIADSAPQVRGGGLQLTKTVGLTIVTAAVLGLLLGVVFALLRTALRHEQ